MKRKLKDDRARKLRGDGNQLSPAQRTALSALVAGARTNEAADAAGVTGSTLSGWINRDEAFRAALKEAQGEVLRRVVDETADTARDVSRLAWEIVHDGLEVVHAQQRAAMGDGEATAKIEAMRERGVKVDPAIVTINQIDVIGRLAISLAALDDPDRNNVDSPRTPTTIRDDMRRAVTWMGRAFGRDVVREILSDFEGAQDGDTIEAAVDDDGVARAEERA